MHQISIKVGRVGSARIVRGTVTEEAKVSPEVMVIVHDADLLAGLNKAIRILTGERDALKIATVLDPAVNKTDFDEEEDEDEA